MGRPILAGNPARSRLSSRLPPDGEEDEIRHHQRESLTQDFPNHYTQTSGAITSLDHTKGEITGERRDALEFLHAWLNDPTAPRYCSLLGEYGMGKTTTVRKLTLDLLENPAAPARPSISTSALSVTSPSKS